MNIIYNISFHIQLPLYLRLVFAGGYVDVVVDIVTDGRTKTSQIVTDSLF